MPVGPALPVGELNGISGIWKENGEANLLILRAGDGDRTRDVQLRKLDSVRLQKKIVHGVY
jgi:hypothetical protein